MNSHKNSTLSPELIGIWISRGYSRYTQALLRILWASTGSILLIIFIEIINHLGLVPVAAFLISGGIILSLEYYTSKIPHITIPFSQGVIIVLAGYIQYYTLLSQQTGFLDSPNIPLLPDLLSMILGIAILIRTVTGIELIRRNKENKNARVPLSGYSREALITFETNLHLASSQIQKEFSDKQPIFAIKQLLTYIFFSIGLLLILLTPLWLNLLLDVVIYPYILLIPGILGSLLMVFYFPLK
ncbi:MAG: hypothetical protein ACFFB5_04155 [Promethearchaeota archaeon]